MSENVIAYLMAIFNGYILTIGFFTTKNKMLKIVFIIIGIFHLGINIYYLI